MALSKLGSVLSLGSGEAIDRFLSHLVPSCLNVFFSSHAHAPEATPYRETWYGAQYGKQPLDPVRGGHLGRLTRQWSGGLLGHLTRPLPA